MILNVYSIRDSRSGFMSLIADQNDPVAMRNFEHACADRSSNFFTHGEDFSLCRLGTFDLETGVITPCLPEVICVGKKRDV